MKAFVLPAFFLLAAWLPVAGLAQDETLPAVTVVEAQLSDVSPAETFTGRVEAQDIVNLRARIQGFLEQRLFKEGDFVEEGELLFQIESDDYQAQVDFVKGAIVRLEGTRNLAEIQRKRRLNLFRQKAGSKDDLDEAIANLAQATGDLQSQQAALKQAELNLSYTEVRAPFSGRIGYSPFSVGDYVTPQSGSLATLVSQDPMFVTFPISQRELLEVQKTAAEQGLDVNEVTVKLRLANGELYDALGTLESLDVQADPRTDTISLRAEFPNKDLVLIHQQLITVVLEQEAVSKITVPQQAIQLDQAGAYVLLVDEQDTVQIRRIERGIIYEGLVVIEKGLNQGERVITVGVQKVRPGVVVAPTLVPTGQAEQN